ncbi:MAG TPA: galactokinase [Acidimicrobiales bacterium]|nr:galactokinase [Acidimicrobiales bacterium]
MTERPARASSRPGRPPLVIRAYAPGRVNLIGDHTDYTGGLVLPMAVDLGTTVEGERGGDAVRLVSADAGGEAIVPLGGGDPSATIPPWARYVAGVVSVVRPAEGFTGRVSTTLPIGAGLSSSAALEVAVALAIGFRGSPLELALACQEAEQRASGVPCGVMDQLASAAGVAGHALLVDCTALTVTPVPLPPAAEVVVIHSGQPRALAGSAYAERRRSCEAAAALVGPLARASVSDLGGLDDAVLRRRARHVVTENGRVRAFAEALVAGDLAACGRLMVESHRSLAGDFEVSTPRLDELVDGLVARPGVLGARMTGAGFGGCVVALTGPGALPEDEGWHVRAVDGARVS